MRDWLPRTKRNRWAMRLASFNLLLLFGWNLLPNYKYEFVEQSSSYQWVAKEMVSQDIWPSIYESVFFWFQSSLNFSDILAMTITFALLFTILAQLCFVPLWRIFSQSKLMRMIPLAICSVGFLAMSYFLLTELPDMITEDHFTFLVLSLITLNFLFSGVILLLYHPEPIKIETIH